MFELTPWRKSGSGDLVGFKSEVDNLFNRFFDLDFPLSRVGFREGQWAPRLDVNDSEEQITVQAEIPGCDSKDIDVSLNGRMLTINGEKKQEKEEKNENFIRVERTHGRFSRSVELPTDVEQDAVEAIYKKGVLKVILKKTVPVETKKIEIKTS